MKKLSLNPYTVGPPVAGTNFYGRTKLLHQVERSLQTTNIILLQGQRRIGKTSLLKQLVHKFSSEPLKIPVFFDLQRYLQDSLPQFQYHLTSVISRAIAFTLPNAEKFAQDSAFFQENWLGEVEKHIQKQELVILLDEFDNFDEDNTSNNIQVILSFLGNIISSEIQIKWVLAVGRLSNKLSLKYDQFLRTAAEFRLTFLNLEETTELIMQPAQGELIYTSESIDYIYSLTKGQPHLTQALCSKTFEYVLGQDTNLVTPEIIDKIIPQTLEAYKNAITSIVNVSPVKKKVLIAITQLTSNKETTNRNQVVDLLVDNGIHLQRDDVNNAINSLVEWELLEGDFENLKVTIKLVEVW